MACGLVVLVGEVLSSHPVVWILYCRAEGLVLHGVGFVGVGAQSPWNRLSGVRFSCTTRMICWKKAIWAEAGAVRQIAANAKGGSRFICFPYRFCSLSRVIRQSARKTTTVNQYNSVVRTVSPAIVNSCVEVSVGVGVEIGVEAVENEGPRMIRTKSVVGRAGAYAGVAVDQLGALLAKAPAIAG